MFWISKNKAHNDAKIHKESCPHCNNGKGHFGHVTDVINVEWVQFTTYDDALVYSNGLKSKVSNCKVCRPELLV